nr:MAG TPA: hypothetical protein [Caudoviricetes sp.]
MSKYSSRVINPHSYFLISSLTFFSILSSFFNFFYILTQPY